MIDPKVLRELLQIFKRSDIPMSVRTSIPGVLGEGRYEPAREALLAGMVHPDAAMRSSCIKALSIDWELQDVGPLLIDILLNDEFEFVRMDAAAGLGALRYEQALPALKEVILDDKHDMTFREAAYEAVLSILGKDDTEFPEGAFGQRTIIDWDLVRSL